MSIGRNSIGLLRRLARGANVRLVDPYTSSHELIQRAEAVAVICSTVGLEALLYDKPVLTLGQPFYCGLRRHRSTSTLRARSATRCPSCSRFRPDPERIARFLHAAMRALPPGRARARRPLATRTRVARRTRSSAVGEATSPHEPRGRFPHDAPAVLFWDIDGTLLLTGARRAIRARGGARAGDGRRGRASQERRPPVSPTRSPTAALRSRGRRAREHRRRSSSCACTASLSRRYLGRGGHVMRACAESLEDLAPRTDVAHPPPDGQHPGRRGGEARALRPRGLLPRGGAFCIGPGERAEIARRALALAAARTVYVIGDTPHDIAAARRSEHGRSRSRPARTRAERARGERRGASSSSCPTPAGSAS